jgi:hypothetical protein
MSDWHVKSGEDMMEVLAHDIMRYEALPEQSDLLTLASALAGNASNAQYLWSWMLNENLCWIISPPLKNERLENNSSIYCKKHVMRYKANLPQISENFIKYTMKAKIYK